jgi:hypothetical protein
MPPDDQVVRLAREVHSSLWRMSSDESIGDKLAARITSAWQDRVQGTFPERFVSEHPVARHLHERIDLVDLEHGVAYELKVSPNNDHFEFYRDIFKVLIARDNLLPQLREFCFLCPAVAARRYGRGLRKAVLDEGPRLNLVLFVASI